MNAQNPRGEKPRALRSTLARRSAARKRATLQIRLPAASAEQRGFLVIYERPGEPIDLADVYELAGMAVIG